MLIVTRRDPNLLFPGDILFIPQRPADGPELSARTTNVYAADVPRTPITLRSLRGAAPRANATVTYAGLPDDTEAPSTTDGEGCLRLDGPVHLPSFDVFFDDEPEVVYSILIGYLDPIEEVPGMVERMRGLGYYPFEAEDPAQLNDDLFETSSVLANELVRSYNAAHGLEGEPYPTPGLLEQLRVEFSA